MAQTSDGTEALVLDVPAEDMRAAWEWFRGQRTRTGMWPIAVASARDIVEGGETDHRYRGQEIEAILLDRCGVFDLEHRSWWLPSDEHEEEPACIDFASLDLFVPQPPGVGPATFDLALEISGYGDTFNGREQDRLVGRGEHDVELLVRLTTRMRSRGRDGRIRSPIRSRSRRLRRHV